MMTFRKLDKESCYSVSRMKREFGILSGLFLCAIFMYSERFLPNMFLEIPNKKGFDLI